MRFKNAIKLFAIGALLTISAVRSFADTFPVPVNPTNDGRMLQQILRAKGIGSDLIGDQVALFTFKVCDPNVLPKMQLLDQEAGFKNFIKLAGTLPVLAFCGR